MIMICDHCQQPGNRWRWLKDYADRLMLLCYRCDPGDYNADGEPLR
jgi:hypothetical protein